MRTVLAHHPCVEATFPLAVHEVGDAYISAELAATGGWEPFETEVLARLLNAAARRLGTPPLLVDGGANLGW